MIIDSSAERLWTAEAAPRAARPSLWARLGWIEWFILTIFLSSGLLLIPGAQAGRLVIRALPYVASLALLALYGSVGTRSRTPPGSTVLLGALLLLVVNLLHPFTDLRAGLAQVCFQISIAGPLFWVGKAVGDREHLSRLLWLTLGATGFATVIAALQVVMPQRFMPPQFSADPAVLALQTYVGPFGLPIVRPPGLTDLPGGAAFAASVAAVLGLAMAARSGGLLVRLATLGISLLSLGVLYLTQVRVMAVMTVMALAAFAALAMVAGRNRGMVTAAAAAVGVVVLVAVQRFLEAALDDPVGPAYRFRVLLEEGLWNAFLSNRGQFFAETFQVLLPKYPLGAGVGRWGMMHDYFGGSSPFGQIWAEVQLTGWLLDGGIPMWLLYGGAIVLAMGYALSVALRRSDPALAEFGAAVFAVQIIVAGSSLAGPTFNTSFGMLFWLLTAALYAVSNRGAQGEAGR